MIEGILERVIDILVNKDILYDINTNKERIEVLIDYPPQENVAENLFSFGTILTIKFNEARMSYYLYTTGMTKTHKLSREDAFKFLQTSILHKKVWTQKLVEKWFYKREE